ncbi:MAG TPA: DUF1015 domain-containing protein [Nitrospina sp.]|nr:DUF1015 domain-containing protein [Nitrospina sp.]
MVDITPFRGLLFNQKKTGPIDQVIAPPYDVISSKEQDTLYKKNPYNVVRLILEKQYSEDDENDNRYTRSSATFVKWIEDGILVEDQKLGFYVYSQEYVCEGESVCRVGFFARVRLEDFDSGNICPHEFTLAKAKQDRMNLLKACRANFSPIFGLFSDPSGVVDASLNQTMKENPFAVIEENGVLNKAWRIDDDEKQAFIIGQFYDKKIFIADGHHRYETALNYYKENKNEVGDSGHVMMFLTNLDAQSLAVYPIHRLIKSPAPFDETIFIDQLKKYFFVEPLDKGVDENKIRKALDSVGEDSVAFFICFGQGRGCFVKVKEKSNILSLLEVGESEELKTLDVVQLHTMILKNILNIDTKQSSDQKYVTYKVDMVEALDRVNSSEFDLAFFINPTPVNQVRNLAEKGIRLPQKATFFYPKLLSGLVINKFKP